MNHTPGPWEVHEATHADGEFWCSIGYAGRGPITDIVGAEGNYTRFFQPVAGMKYLVTPVEQQRANARLIAAAPQMLDALEAIAYWMSDANIPCCFPRNSVLQAIDAAKESAKAQS